MFCFFDCVTTLMFLWKLKQRGKIIMHVYESKKGQLAQ